MKLPIHHVAKYSLFKISYLITKLVICHSELEKNLNYWFLT